MVKYILYFYLTTKLVWDQGFLSMQLCVPPATSAGLLLSHPSEATIFVLVATEITWKAELHASPDKAPHISKEN